MNFLSDLVANLYGRNSVEEPEEYQKSFVENMVVLLNHSGLSPKDLAERVGMKPHQFNYVLYGTGRPKPELLSRLVGVAKDYSLYRLADWFDTLHLHTIRNPRKKRDRDGE